MNAKRLRMGLVGGGPGSFIGRVHYQAAILDGEIELVCGCFSSDPGKSVSSGETYHIPRDRSYSTFKEMIEGEKMQSDETRMDFVAITTPNHLHYEQARLALENGFNVMCDKPLTTNLPDATMLAELTAKTGLLFGVTYPYMGYPMILEARKLVTEGIIGEARKVVVEYPQGWLSRPIEKEGHKQAGWRSDPRFSGDFGAMADIGVHAFNLAEFIVNQEIKSIYADIASIVPGRELDDDGDILMRFESGLRGLMFATQIAAGEENDVNIRVWGEKGGVEWHHASPNQLIVKILDKPRQLYQTGNPSYLSSSATLNTRLPGGHPEGFIEAFANLYRNFAAVAKSNKSLPFSPSDPHYFPTIHEGVRGMRFLEAIKLSVSMNQWVDMV